MATRETVASVVSVNEVVIANQDIAREMQYHPADSRDQAYWLAARALVIRELLLQQAARKGIGVKVESSDPETSDEIRIRLLLEKEVNTPRADEAACRNYYHGNLNRFRSWPLIEARHILIPALPKDLEGRREAKKLADDVLSQLIEDVNLFPDLAKQHSACPSKDDGGHLGQISRGQTASEFERQLFALPKGLAHRPVETRYGYHIVEVLRRVEGRALDFDQVAKKIADYLNENVRRRATGQYIRYLIGKASIQGIKLDTDDSPLMQ